MHPTYEATLKVAGESLGMLREAITGLPDKAMDWKPAPDANSMNVLVMHSISATRFWIQAGAGEDVSLEQYRKEDRGPAFATVGRSAGELTNAITGFLGEMETMLASANPEVLDATREWPEDPSMNKTGVQCLIHALAHLREHVGQAQLTRDLWLASQG